MYWLSNPILGYELVLRSEKVQALFSKSFAPNKTEVVLGPEDGLEENQKYACTVTAITLLE